MQSRALSVVSQIIMASGNHITNTARLHLTLLVDVFPSHRESLFSLSSKALSPQGGDKVSSLSMVLHYQWGILKWTKEPNICQKIVDVFIPCSTETYYSILGSSYSNTFETIVWKRRRIQKKCRSEWKWIWKLGFWNLGVSWMKPPPVENIHFPGSWMLQMSLSWLFVWLELLPLTHGFLLNVSFRFSLLP